MRKLAFLALAIAAVGCSTATTTDSSVSSEVAVPAIGDLGVSPAQVRAFEKLQLDTGSRWAWLQHETHGTPSHLSTSRTGKALLVADKTAARTTIELVD
ncbi:MAG: bacillolysin, partial [Myxococcales bacterium]|nr:bacillolysin [Myxococcales bacterium]